MVKKYLLAVLVFIFVLQINVTAYGDSGLVGYWKFDAVKDNIALDSSGNNIDGYVNKLLWGVLGRVNVTLLFDGKGYIAVGDNEKLDFDANDSFTVSAWVKLDDSISGYKAILGKASDSSLNGYMLRHDQDGNLSMRIVGSEHSNDSTSVAKQDYRDGQWHHVVGVIDRTNNTNTIYVDGVQKDQSSANHVGDLTNSYFFSIGALDRGNIIFKGLIDEVRVYDRALSSAEVRQLYTQDCDCIVKGDLLQATDDYKVYYINKNSHKKWIINENVFNLYNNKWQDVIKVSPNALETYPTVKVIRAIGNDEVYEITGLTKQWIQTAQEFESLGYKWEDIDNVLVEELNEYQ